LGNLAGESAPSRDAVIGAGVIRPISTYYYLHIPVTPLDDYLPIYHIMLCGVS
jgi:hypothetical protein